MKMRLDVVENYRIELSEVFNSITLKTVEGRKIHICQRDWGFEIKTDAGQLFTLNPEDETAKFWNFSTLIGQAENHN